MNKMTGVYNNEEINSINKNVEREQHAKSSIIILLNICLFIL